MSRIKYRVWSVKDKTYDDPYSHSYYAMTQDGELDFYCYGDYWDSCDPEEYIVEQFTGLKDTNGKEIYEGDIVKMHYFFFDGRAEAEREVVGMVDIDFAGAFTDIKGERYYWLHYLEEPSEEIEVIGNIHENSDLLDKQKQS